MKSTSRKTSATGTKQVRLSGFTLVELIVVIAILAILATIGFLALSGYSQDAKSSVLKTNVRSVYTAIGLESTVSGNSPRYYVVHDPSVTLNGALVVTDGKTVPLTGGTWNAPNTNYSAGNPDFPKLKLNPDKFRISYVRPSEYASAFFDWTDTVRAGYDSNTVAVGAADVQGTTDTRSYFQVTGTDTSGLTVVVGDYPASSGSTAGLIDDPTDSGSGALTDGKIIAPGATVTASLATATLPKGKLTVSYNGGSGFDFKTLYSVTGDAAYNSSSVTWAVTSGSLPTGLSLGANGVITGTPTVLNAGQTFEISGTYNGKTARQNYTMAIIDNLLEAVQVSNGANFSCAVTVSWGAKCWGDNSSGQIGDGTTTARLVPVDVSGLTSGVAEVAAGTNFACAVLTNGTMKCWGNNAYGQLGKGSGGNSLTPVAVSGIASGTTHVATGDRHACAIVSGGAKCWGYNYNSQLGDGTSSDRNAPVSVSGLSSGVTGLEAGGTHTCAVVSGGAKCWGNNGSYQLGDGTTFTRSSPVDVSNLTTGVVAIGAGGTSSCALTTSGGMKCWSGWSGNGTGTNQSTPVDVSGMTLGVSKIRVGSNSHTCLVTAAGAAKCWGVSGGEYRLGDGGSSNTTTPFDVSGMTSGVVDVGVWAQGCALKSDNTVKCWGYYAGNNTSSAQTLPVFVMGG